MSSWHGHAQAPDAVEDRPWWINVHHPDEHGPTVVMRGFGPTDSLLQRRDMPGPGQVEALYEAMDAWDAAHPRPVPAPACGQVWAWPSGSHRMVVAIESSGVAVFGGRVQSSDGHWPPRGAVLVAGPQAPWAAAGG